MNEKDLLRVCRNLYDQHGFKALTFQALQAQGQLYATLYHRGLSHSALIEKLELKDAYLEYRKSRPKTYAGKIRVPWTWDRVVVEAKAAMERQGRLPPSLWFQKNGLGALIHFVYRSGRSWADLRTAVGDFADSKFVESRNGLRWLSHAEASLNNFLYARGIEHKKGERYADSITDISDAKYAFYDLHLRGTDGEWVDIEVWGDIPLGHEPVKYARRRKAKEIFNQANPRFVGIHHEACYDDTELTRILEPFIGAIMAFQFDKPTDRVIPSTHWSNADELLDYCRKLASEMPGGIFPTEEWLRKRGKWADRPGPVYNTLAIYIRLWIGGVRKLREILNQQHASTIQWDAESALREYKRFFDEYGKTPGQVLGMFNDGTADGSISENVVADASRIVSAVSKYVGSALEAQQRLGMKPSRRYWDAESARAAWEAFLIKHGITPSQAVDYWHRKTSKALSEQESQFAASISRAFRKYCGPIFTVSLNLRRRWDARSAMAAYREFVKKHGLTPYQAVYYWYRKTSKALPEAESEYARAIVKAVQRHVGAGFRISPSSTRSASGKPSNQLKTRPLFKQKQPN